MPAFRSIFFKEAVYIQVLKVTWNHIAFPSLDSVFNQEKSHAPPTYLGKKMHA